MNAMLPKTKKWSDIVVLASGASAVALGLVVMGAWYGQQVAASGRTGFLPVHFNTALGFFLAGIALLSLTSSFRLLGLSAAGLTMTLGIFALGEYLLRLNLHLDQMFLPPDLARVPEAERVTPNAALCFAMLGSATMLKMKANSTRFASLLSGLMSVAVCILGIVAVGGYFFKIPSAYAWANLSAMSFQAAATFAIIGMGMTVVSWRDLSLGGSPRFLPLLVSLGCGTLTLILWQSLVTQEHTRLQRSVNGELDRVKKNLATEINARIGAISLLAADWQQRGSIANDNWESAARNLLDRFGHCETLARVSAAFELQSLLVRHANGVTTSAAKTDFKLNTAALELARDGRQVSIRSDAVGNKFWITLPVFYYGKLQGFVVGAFHLQEFASSVLNRAVEAGYAVSLTDESRGGFNFGVGSVNPLREPGQEWSQSALVETANANWQVRLWPKSEVLSQEFSKLPTIALMIGVLISGWAGLGVKMAQTARSRSRQLETMNDKLRQEILERERMEFSLRSSELHFRSVTQSALDAIISLDKYGNIIFWNKAAEKIFGHSERDMLGQPLTRILPERYRAHNEQGLISVQALGKNVLIGKSVELEGRRKDGTEFPAEISLSTWKNGDETYYTGIVHDITERRRVQEQLSRANDDLEARVQERSLELLQANRALADVIHDREEVEESLNFALESAQLGHWDLDLIADTSRRSLRHDQIFGYTSLRLNWGWTTFIRHVVAEDRAAVEEKFKRATMTGEKFEIECRILWPDKSLHWISVNGRVVHDSQKHPLRLAAVVMDITERKQGEEALSKFAALVESSEDAIITKALDGTIISWNPAAERLFGYSSVEAKARSISMLMPRERVEEEECIMENLRRGQRLEHFETVRLHKDGRRLDVSVTVSPIKNSRGETIGASQIARDIRSQKRAEAELHLHRSHLEHLVTERTKELQEINTELQSFSYTVSHDLRAPLRAMQGFADALAEDYATSLDATGRDYVKRIIGGAQRMDKLIQDLLIYSRVGRAELELAPIDLERALADACAQLETVIAEREASIKLEQPLPGVRGHHSTLVQVLTNLISNAIKFTAPEVKPEVRIRAEERGDNVRLWVEDNGIGIQPEHHERIFGVFERLHGNETYPGTGIGLAIVRKGLERMNGVVGLESGLNQGSKFWIELPKEKIS